MTNSQLHVGAHYLVELSECDISLINSESHLRERLLEAIGQSGARIIRDVFHSFSPHGVTGVVVIAESHVSIHTWPEHGYAAVDIFTCSEKMRMPELIEAIKLITGSFKVVITKIDRGPTSQREAEISS